MSIVESSKDCLVRVGPMVNIPVLLRELGCNPDPIIKRAGFKPDEFSDTEHKVSYLLANRLLALCVAETGNDQFGLRLGCLASTSHLGLTGFLVKSAPTVGIALQSLVENLDLHEDGGSCSLQIEKDYTRLSYNLHLPGISAIAQVYDMSAVIMVRIMRSLCGNEFNAAQVCLIRERPSDLTRYTRYFRAPIIFDTDTCCIVFSSYLLQRKPPGADDFLFHHLEQEAHVFHQMHQQEILDTLPAVLQHGLLLNRFSARDIANEYGIQERTLHRRLQAAGTSFRHELDSVRELLSLQMLESSSLPICDIATSMGYADSSGFIRAFHRWTGSSPASWRKRNGTAHVTN